MSDPLMAALDVILGEIEDQQEQARGASRIPVDLWKDLGDLAEELGHGYAPPKTYAKAHDYVFELQEIVLAQPRPQARPRPVARRQEPSFAWDRRMQAIREREPGLGWAWWAWQSAADDAALYPSYELWRRAQGAWAYYWRLLERSRAREAA